MGGQNVVMPVVDESRCNGCGVCVTKCPAGAVRITEGRVEFLSNDACTYCGVCEDICPEGAVSLYFEVSYISD